MENEGVVVDYAELNSLIDRAGSATGTASNAASYIASAGGGVSTGFVGKTSGIVSSLNAFSSSVSQAEAKVDSILAGLVGDFGLGEDSARSLSLTGDEITITDIDGFLDSLSEEEKKFYEEWITPMITGDYVDFESLGLSDSEVILDALKLYNKNGKNYARNVINGVCFWAPEGFEYCNFQKETASFSLAQYYGALAPFNRSTITVDGKVKYREYSFYKENVNINGHDFQFLQGISKDKASVLYNLLMDSYQVMVIEELSKYPDEMLKVVGASTEKTDGSVMPSRVFFVDDLHGVTGSKFLSYYQNGTVVLQTNFLGDAKQSECKNSYISFPDGILHEFGHKFDDMVIDGVSDADVATEDDNHFAIDFQKINDEVIPLNDRTREFLELSKRNFQKMENIDDPEFVYNGNYTDIDEMMAELSEFYVAHNQELKEQCPEYYNFMEQLLQNGGEVINTPNKPIYINGEMVNITLQPDGKLIINP